MTLLFDKARSIESPALAPEAQRGNAVGDGAAVLEIGLVNNMPDAALRATERQFVRVLNAAAGQSIVRLHCFALPSVPRGAAAKARIDSLYADVADLGKIKLDGLIVTGAEPRAAALPHEDYWPALTELIDWAEANTRSTIWSCLAAHAAVLHLDGIERRKLDRKCSGVYQSVKRQDDALLADLKWPLRVPHSRLNDLPIDELSVHGYRILATLPDAGVDIFVRQQNSRFVFLQGHPEYDPVSLQREYQRDLCRFLSGERNCYPDYPANYFDAATELALDGFRARAVAQRDPKLFAILPAFTLRLGVAAETESAATALFCNWLKSLAVPR